MIAIILGGYKWEAKRNITDERVYLATEYADNRVINTYAIHADQVYPTLYRILQEHKDKT